MEINPVHVEQAKILAIKDSERQRKWFDAGLRAAKRGYGDLSPYYKNATADYFFKCGYNNVSFEEAQATLKDKLQQIFEQDSTLKESMNEIVK